VLLIRKIRELLYEQGFTISGARNRLDGGEDSLITASIPPISSNASVQSDSTNDIDFFAFKKEIRDIIQLLRA
jgi:hypothetical protein